MSYLKTTGLHAYLPSSHEGEAGSRKDPVDLFSAERVRVARTPGGMCPERRGWCGVEANHPILVPPAK